MRRIATELRPLMLDDLGLVPTIEWLVQRFFQAHGYRGGVAICPSPISRWTPELSTALFRVLQESLTNVARHADASHVRVTLTGTRTAMSGCRCMTTAKASMPRPKAARKTFGLLGMRERAGMLGGELTVRQQPRARARPL